MRPTLNQAIVYVSQMPRAVAFYHDVLGLPLLLETETWSELLAGQVTLALHLTHRLTDAAEPPLPAGQVELQFSVGDLDAACAELRAQGIAVEGPRVMAGLDFPLATLRDPDGLSIILVP